MTMYKKILVPLDGSDLAEQVLPHVIELARSCGAEIILLRVATVPVYDYLVTEPQWGIELRREAERETVEYLERIRHEVAAGDSRSVHVRAWMAMWTQPFSIPHKSSMWTSSLCQRTDARGWRVW